MPRPPAYKIGDKKVPGTTTPINQWGGNEKINNLCDWAQRLAVNYEYCDGELIHIPKYWVAERDARGAVGTLTHALWSKHIDRMQPDPDYSKATIEQRDEALLLFADLKKWLVKNPLNIIAIEEPLVSRKYKYGGTPDVIANKIVDVKTGFVNEFTCMLQLSAYNNLAIENGLTSDNLDGIILQPYEGKVREYYFSAKTLSDHFDTFLALLKVYNDDKKFDYLRKKKWK